MIIDGSLSFSQLSKNYYLFFIQEPCQVFRSELVQLKLNIEASDTVVSCDDSLRWRVSPKAHNP